MTAATLADWTTPRPFALHDLGPVIYAERRQALVTALQTIAADPTEHSSLSMSLALSLKKEPAAGSVLAHHRTEAGHPPQRQVDGGGVVVHQIGKAPTQ